MQHFRKILILVIILSSNINFAQEFSKFKYIIIRDLIYKSGGVDTYGLSKNSRDYFKDLGYITINPDGFIPNDLKNNPCLGLNLTVNNDFSSGFGGNLTYGVSMDFRDCFGNSIKKIRESCSNDLASEQKNYDKALRKCFKELKDITYKFDENLIIKIFYPEVENINMDEVALKSYFDNNNNLNPIEGIYKSFKSESIFKIGIIKIDDKYKAIVLESDLNQWKKGDIKAIFETTAISDVYTVTYYMANKTANELFAKTEGSLITIEIKNEKGDDAPILFIKLYPKL